MYSGMTFTSPNCCYLTETKCKIGYRQESVTSIFNISRGKKARHIGLLRTTPVVHYLFDLI